MPPPKDLPGFYFDPEKNRYFPMKGPIPGVKRPSSASISGESLEKNKRAHRFNFAAKGKMNYSHILQKHGINKEKRRNRLKPLDLLQSRELLGTSILSNKCKRSFKQEYEKSQASCAQYPEATPRCFSSYNRRKCGKVWKYQRTDCVADTALEQMHGVLQTPEGLKETYLLSAGSVNGSISLYEVGNVGRCLNSGSRCTPEHVWREGTKYEARDNSLFGSIWSSAEASTNLSSSISCIRRIGRHCSDLADDASSFQRALVTTLGSGASGGSVYIVNLTESLDFSPSALHLRGRTLKINSFDCTIWTADCSMKRTHAVIGTNLGAALINLETRASSWVYRTKSDVFSQQFDHSGNVVLCGLRNGAIIVVDVREKQSRTPEVSSRHTRAPSAQRANHAPPIRRDQRSKQRFEAKRASTSSSHSFMSSAVCSLVALQSDDQYFLGSSMDGSIKLFDRRLLHRGAIQSYEGHVNSHSHLQLGVNPSESLVLSGGEDQYVRIWSIKTSELIFEENVSNSILATVCWPQGAHGLLRPTRYCEENPFELNHSWGAWLGSREGLFYMHGT